MVINENKFFRESTLRICSSLDIGKAMQSCLKYFSEFIPVTQLSFHIYDRDLGIVETVALANLQGSRTMAMKTPLSEKGRLQVEEQRSMRIKFLKHMGCDAVTGPVVRQLGCEKMPGIVMDLVLDKEFIGTVATMGHLDGRFSKEHMHLFTLINEPFAMALANCLRYRELQAFRDKLADDNRYLQNELRQITGEQVIGADFGLKEVMRLVKHVAPLSSPVLLLGETGTGKEVIANAIHNLSSRNQMPFIRVNCGAIPESLMDSELFGHEKGAFTGALAQRRGRFERAHGGTIFLDEVGELSLEAQIRLLRVLQEKEIERVGGTETIRLDIRVVAATHRNLEKMLVQGKFREDLYFRLRVFPITIPSLRDRKMDIPILTQYFIQKKSIDMGLDAVPGMAPGALKMLMQYHWPGNVRELENAVERSLIISKGGMLNFAGAHHVGDEATIVNPRRLDRSSAEITALDEVMAMHIKKILKKCNGRIEGPHGAATLLAIHPSTLRKRMDKLGIPYGRRNPPRT